MRLYRESVNAYTSKGINKARLKMFELNTDIHIREETNIPNSEIEIDMIHLEKLREDLK